MAKKSNPTDPKEGSDDRQADESGLGRREFFRTGAAAGAGALMLSAATGSANAQESEMAAEVEGDWDHDVDVLVCGSGNGGMSAAIAAAEGGADTLVLEISTQIGGNTLMSGGIMHTATQRNWEDYNNYTDGLHHQELAKLYVETFWNDYIPWLQSHNAYMSRPNPDGVGWAADWNLGNGEPGQLRHKLYFDSLVAAFEGLGGTIQRQTRVRKLLTDEDGAVIGVRAQVWENSPKEPNQRWINVRAKKVIMAIGGWIGDGERKQRYFGQDAHMARVHCGPFSSGEGLDICQAVGSALSQHGWSTFSGTPCAVTATAQTATDPDWMIQHWADKPPEEWNDGYNTGKLSPPPWIDAVGIQFGGVTKGLMVNRYGERFIDESSPIHSKYARLNHAIVRQEKGFVWMIGDQAIHDDTPGSDAAIQAIIDEGGVMGTEGHGNVIIADTLEEFADALVQAGVYKGGFMKTIEEYNEAVDAGTTEDLSITRTNYNGAGEWPIRNGPFYAIPITAMPYLCFGGLRIDGDARALDAQDVPVPNLYAPPPLGGGIYNEVYTGAIAQAGTFGYLAGKHAAANLAG